MDPKGAAEPLTDEELAELRRALEPSALPVWGTRDGRTHTWVTTPDVSARITAALRALPRLLDEVTDLRDEVRKLQAEADAMADIIHGEFCSSDEHNSACPLDPKWKP